jgi:hypothetical protein
MSHVSPGIFSKIIDLSNYVQSVPSTIGYIPFLSKQGRDNQLLFMGGTSDLISEFGSPNIQQYGKNYGQGPYIAYNFLGQSGSLYVMRCMPDDASYSNLIINGTLSNQDSTASVTVSYANNVNSYAEIMTSLETDSTTFPLCMIHPIGRGDHYNSISLRFTPVANPLLPGVFVLDVYEKQSDGDEVIVESFQVSFNPNATDLSGDSIWISYILDNYSNILRCQMQLSNESFTSGYDLLINKYDNNIGNISIVESNLSASITDDKQNFTQWENIGQSGNATYMIQALDARGNVLTGWLGAVTPGTNNETIAVFNARDLSTASQSWVGNTAIFDTSDSITYTVQESFTSIATAFISANPIPLKKGSDGSLINANGSLNSTTATQVLADAYSGILKNPVTGSDEDSVLDTENYYYSMVFDAGYPADVKVQISALVTTRRDCVAILDNGDNSSFNNAITTRENSNTFNNYYTSLYESFNKVYDIFTGQDIWVSPIYHMAYILPANDNVAELWYAPAGFNRASIDSIRELRYSPQLGQRDQMYLKQLNPIVKFSQGYVVWGQLTSQAKSSALSNLPVVRMVLYIKRAFETFCRNFIFEQNDEITWGQVASQMQAFLEDIKTKRGLDSYTINVYATDYMKKTKTFTADISLTPTEAVEQIDLNFFIM